jgi:tRNA 5-methylaminomethyl-2-thiouridine biosynthesis bifunctional protein
LLDATAWAARSRYVVLDASFGLGERFLRLWQAWRDDTKRPERLCVVVLADKLPEAQAIRRAHAGGPHTQLATELAQAWPSLTPNLHTLHFEQGRVQLLLALGRVQEVLRSLHVQADELWVDGGDAWPWLRWLGRLAAPNAHLRFSGPPSDNSQHLAVSAGFALGADGWRFAPHHTVRSPPRLHPAPARAHAVVVGAGIAGAAAAQALLRQGLQVTVFEARTQVASLASGNAAGIFHGTVNIDDGIYARLFRAAALAAAFEYQQAINAGQVPGSTQGLLRMEWRPTGLAGMRALLKRTGLPASYVQALSQSAASKLAGVPLSGPAWFYPQAGWVSPAAWVQHALRGTRCVLRTPVSALQRSGSSWRVLGAQQQVLAEADVVVLAHAESAASLVQQLGHAPWPLSHTRGQVTQWASRQLHPKLPVAGDGYALATGDYFVCGATREVGLAPGQRAPRVRLSDHGHNLQRLQRLTGQVPPSDTAAVSGRAAWRLHTDDRLPIAGPLPLPLPLPLANLPQQQRSDQVRLAPREQGLFVLTALGARGLTLAPLLAQLVAAQACGAPWPLEQPLVDALDPARWWVRRARRAARDADD